MRNASSACKVAWNLILGKCAICPTADIFCVIKNMSKANIRTGGLEAGKCFQLEILFLVRYLRCTGFKIYTFNLVEFYLARLFYIWFNIYLLKWVSESRTKS